jgi:DNA (cytosine-5)-methyltransferase 1
MENVREFQEWGPLSHLHIDGVPQFDRAGKPIMYPNRDRKGETFRRFVGQLRRLGYHVEWRVLDAAEFGAPTHRRRLFLIARCDGLPITWPTPTHGKGRRAFRTAAECIDWALPCPSIFDRPRPLAEKTLRRIAMGIGRYVLQNPTPFIVGVGGRAGQSPAIPISSPLGTTTTKADRALVVPTLIQTGYGERKGQAPRVLDLHAPHGTVVAGGQKSALVTAMLAKHYGGVVGHGVDRPLGTVTAVDHHSLVTGTLVEVQNASSDTGARDVARPAHTITANPKGGGMALASVSVTQPGSDPQRAGLVYAFLASYYGQGVGQGNDRPTRTVTTRDRFALVTVELGNGQRGVVIDVPGRGPHIIADIGLRMLTPRELARCQGFGDDYVLTGTKTSQVARIGNSVCPPVAEAIVRANGGGL